MKVNYFPADHWLVCPSTKSGIPIIIMNVGLSVYADLRHNTAVRVGPEGKKINFVGVKK